MYAGQLVLAQLMDHLPWQRFRRILERYGADRRIREFSCSNQLRCMALAQLAYRESLRDIETCLRAQSVKIAGMEMCWSYNRQHGARFLALMPTNLYGPGEGYDLKNSHLLPALITKIHKAKQSGARQVSLWGSGRPRRGFLLSDDMAEACVFLIGLPDAEFGKPVAPAQAPVINTGAGAVQSIAELAALIADVLGYKGEFVYDASKPNGTPRKLLDSSRLVVLGWNPGFGLREGIALAYEDFLGHHVAAGSDPRTS